MAAEFLALTGATIYTSPEDEPLRDSVIVIRGDAISDVGAAVKIPSGAQRIDCSGLTITAGFWNSHVHFFERKWSDAASIPAEELQRQLRDMLVRYGFTSVFDLASTWSNTRDIRSRIDSGEVTGPRILSVGEGLIPVGMVPSDTVLNMMGVMRTALPEIGDEEQAAVETRRLIDKGVDGVKLFALPENVIASAVREAHQAQRPVFVHPNTAADVLAAARGGADVIAHTTPRSGPWDDVVLEAITTHDIALTPTLTLWQSAMRHDRASAQEKFVATAIAQLRAFRDAGGSVLFGTDLGAVDYDPGPEYELMSSAGMSFRDILASLTTVPAARFGKSKTGRIATGFSADLAVLASDPADSIKAFADVRYTYRSGTQIR